MPKTVKIASPAAIDHCERTQSRRYALSLLCLLQMLTCFAGNSVRADGASRVVVAGGDLTEIVYALGAEDRLVGVDSTSRYPARASALPDIGYLRRLTAEGLLSLKPGLVILAHDAGPASAITALRQSGIRVAMAPATKGADGVVNKITFVGQALGLPDRADQLVARYRRKLGEALNAVDSAAASPKVLFLLHARAGAPLAGGRETSADAIITLAGGQNAAAAMQGYKPMNTERIIEAQPEIILVMQDGAASANPVDQLKANRALAATPAGRSGRIYPVDGLLMLGFGPRTPRAIRQLSALLQTTTTQAR